MAMLLFRCSALGLSGFETGVVMPLVRGDPSDSEQAPLGRIRNAKKLLATAALIMSVMLMGSSLVTAVIIPPAAFQPHQPADGRAIAYLAHELIGNGFGTFYDIATIAILWFAGASAMAGLLNLVPRYLPRYGMAPEWARATRPLVAFYRHHVPRDADFRRQRRRPGRRLRHRRAGTYEPRGARGCDCVAAAAPLHRLRGHHDGVHITHRDQHLRASRDQIVWSSS